MKLNTRRTILIGLAFMSICAFWQLYDTVIPLILKDTFHMNDALSGVVMALDNVLALYLLPMFGALSDKNNTRIGRRMPFILCGTAAAALLMNFIPLIDNRMFLSGGNLTVYIFIAVLALLLVAMGMYRSPAVALMPDLTPKPLRSKANAVINLMGAVGGIIYLGLSAVLYSEKRTVGLEHVDYAPLFLIVSAIMIISVIVLYLTVNEPKTAKEVRIYEAEHPEQTLTVTDETTGQVTLPREIKRSLAFLLTSISLWFMGYNAITTAFTKYAAQEWGMALGSASLCLTIATVGAIVSYIPIGIIASRVGRKLTIITGAALLSLCFLSGYLITLFTDSFTPVLYIVFALVGLAWAAINVNSLPMVVEMCRGADIGKFTGYYYSFSMAAQIVTPILSGILLQYVGYRTLFPYGAIFVGLSIITMLNVRHGDSKPENKKSKLEMLDVGD